jgi:hypothetical protein
MSEHTLKVSVLCISKFYIFLAVFGFLIVQGAFGRARYPCIDSENRKQR